MTRIPNKENVTMINMKPTACVKCGIGKDWYNCKFEAVFFPDSCYPDYMQVQDFVRHEIDGESLNIEEAANKLYNFLMQYEPSQLWVTAHVTDCKTHFDVDVEVGR